MNKFASVILVAGLSGGLLASCGSASEKVLERAASPDGKLEAVLMNCKDPANPSTTLLTGAVFDTKGKNCGDVTTGGLASFVVSNAPDQEGAGASVSWDGQQAVFDVEGDRTLVRRQASGGVALDMIVLKGDFEGADIDQD